MSSPCLPRLGEKAIAEFESEETRAALARHLLRDAGQEAVNEMVLYVAEENLVKVDTSRELTADSRTKVIAQLPKEIAEAATKVHRAALGASVTDFLAALEGQVAPLADVLLKKPDKKKERQLLFGHRQSLLEKVAGEGDAALLLHLAVLALFHQVHGAMLQASGKFVPTIIEHLGKHGLTGEQVEVLTRHQGLVVAGLGGAEVEEGLLTSTSAVRALVEGFKKTAVAE